MPLRPNARNCRGAPGLGSGREIDAMLSQDPDGFRADSMQGQQYVLADPIQIIESSEAGGRQGSGGGPTQSRWQRCG